MSVMEGKQGVAGGEFVCFFACFLSCNFFVQKNCSEKKLFGSISGVYVCS